jgi:hypothetical protein
MLPAGFSRRRRRDLCDTSLCVVCDCVTRHPALYVMCFAFTLRCGMVMSSEELLLSDLISVFCWVVPATTCIMYQTQPVRLAVAIALWPSTAACTRIACPVCLRHTQSCAVPTGLVCMSGCVPVPVEPMSVRYSTARAVRRSTVLPLGSAAGICACCCVGLGPGHWSSFATCGMFGVGKVGV